MFVRRRGDLSEVERVRSGVVPVGFIYEVRSCRATWNGFQKYGLLGKNHSSNAVVLDLSAAQSDWRISSGIRRGQTMEI